MIRRRFSRFARATKRLAVASVALYLAVGLLTGPGVPHVVRGRPALVAHTTIHFTTWAVYYLNEFLLVVAIVLCFSAIIGSLFERSASSEPGISRVALKERLVNASFGQFRRYALAFDAAISDGHFALRGTRFIGPSEANLVVPLQDIGVVWFLRVWGGWKIVGGGPTPETGLFTFSPRNPRRWFLTFQHQRVPMRPVGLTAEQLPRVQVGLLIQLALYFSLVVLAIGAASFMTFQMILKALSG